MKKVFKNLKQQKAALLLGIFITFFSLYISFEFYSTDVAERSRSFWLSALERLHTTSVDHRMLLRGTRLPETPLAVIGIDERAIQAQGRFPWSRHKIATLVEELYRHGAKVVATDIMFSEKSNEELQQILSSIPENSSSSSYAQTIKKFKEEQLRKSDADSHFAEVIQKHRNQFVLSSTYDHLTIPYQPYQLLCYNYIYEQTPYYEFWEEEGYDINVKINAAYDFPEAFTELTEGLEVFLNQSLAQVKKKSTSQFCQRKFQTLSCKERLSQKEIEELQRYLGFAQREYCHRWLKPEDEFLDSFKQSWPQVSQAEELYQGLSFQDFIDGMQTQGGLVSAFFPADFWTNSIPLFNQATRYTGFLNAHPDRDGTIRKSPLVSRSGDQHLSSLAFRSAMVTLGASNARVELQRSPNNEAYLDVSQVDITKDNQILRRIPTDSQARITINYAGPGYTFPHVSAKELFETDNPNLIVTRRVRDQKTGEVILRNEESLDKRKFLEGKTVIIGGTAIGVYDLRVTPFDENFRGVETHINIIDNILREDYLYSASSEPTMMSLVILGLGLLMTLIVSFLGAIPASITTLLLGGIAFWVDKVFFFSQGMVVAIIFPLGLIFSIYLGLTIYKYFTEEKNKKELKGTFGKYVSPAIVEEILSDPANIELGGRKERVTVFFSDVRGFTTISEMLDAAALSDLLNEYLTPMTEIIFENKGTLDKYIGDAIMAFFGAPIQSPNHAKNACRAALQNISKLKELQKGFEERNLPQIDIGIGLNTGEVNVGNMGSNTVRNYTIMGDAVNLGARLEGITKQYGVRCIISEFTETELDDTFFRREIDWVKVKGKNEPVRIFELMDYNHTSEDNLRLIESFNQGFQFYHQMQWQKAIDCFYQGQSHVANDPVCQLYLQRCQDYLKNPPQKDWDGVFTMTTK